MILVSKPIPKDKAKAMYEAIFTSLSHGPKRLVESCDHTLKNTRAWAERNGVEFDELKPWLDANGGFCDCDVLFNMMPHEPEL